MEPADDTALPPEQVRELLEQHPDAQVVDVRTTGSRSGRPVIAGARHLDVKAQLRAGDVSGLLAAGLDPQRPVVTLCNSGGSCRLAASVLREHGFHAHSIDGGMTAWRDAGLPVEQLPGGDA